MRYDHQKGKCVTLSTGEMVYENDFETIEKIKKRHEIRHREPLNCDTTGIYNPNVEKCEEIDTYKKWIEHVRERLPTKPLPKGEPRNCLTCAFAIIDILDHNTVGCKSGEWRIVNNWRIQNCTFSTGYPYPSADNCPQWKGKGGEER